MRMSARAFTAHALGTVATETTLLAAHSAGSGAVFTNLGRAADSC